MMIQNHLTVHLFNIIVIPFLLFQLVSTKKLGRKSIESQLFEDLLYYYNKIPRPVKNSTDLLVIDVGASLIRIIDVDEKNQILTTNLWLEMRWTDSKLRWDPNKYGNITALHMPVNDIWIPDFVLYNNAAAHPDITIFTDALVLYDGRVFWQPPAIYKSFCQIDITWFPYDEQTCFMKFGIWTYTGFYVDLRQLPREDVTVIKDAENADVEVMQKGMDLSFYYSSAEWDLLSLNSTRGVQLYASCCGPEKYVDITYAFVLRRKTLFFTCNLIIPCFLISLLTTFVFYLSDHKITFSIAILVTLTVFFLVLIDIVPPTSLVVPMFGRYLVTTMILVALSTMISVVTVNFRFRNGTAHKMPRWIRSVFLNWLPKILFMSRPNRASSRGSNVKPFAADQQKSRKGGGRQQFVVQQQQKRSKQLLSTSRPWQRSLQSPITMCTTFRGFRKTPEKSAVPNQCYTRLDQIRKERLNSLLSEDRGLGIEGVDEEPLESMELKTPGTSAIILNSASTSLGPSGAGESVLVRTKSPARTTTIPDQRPSAEVRRLNNVVIKNLVKEVRFIAEHFRRLAEDAEISDDWTFAAMVLDRLFLIIFSVLNVATLSILLDAPSLRDTREALNSTVPTKPLGQANLFSIYN